VSNGLFREAAVEFRKVGNLLRIGILAMTATTALATSAFAGGLERGGYNIDLLFDPSRYATEASATLVMPDRKLNNVRDTDISDGLGNNGIGGGASNDVGYTDNYWVPRVGFKAGFNENIDCMVDYSQPWGVAVNPGANWVGANHNIETVVNSDNYAGTCSYKWQLSKGQMRIIGGAFYQQIDGFKERLVAPIPAILGTGVGRLDLETDGWGWRAGVAYEIPEIALRASLVYNSEVEHDNITGTLDLRQVPGAVNPANPLLGRVTNIFGSATMPDSVELKLQSGIAPNWLAFASVKWVNWSNLQAVSFCPESTRGLANCVYGGPTYATSLDLLYRDGWTVSGGIGHKFNDAWSAAGSITWDRGTTTGIGIESDTWTFAAGASYTPNEKVEIRFGGAVGVLTSGSAGEVNSGGFTFGRDIAYDYGTDVVSALSASAKIKF